MSQVKCYTKLNTAIILCMYLCDLYLPGFMAFMVKTVEMMDDVYAIISIIQRLFCKVENHDKCT